MASKSEQGHAVNISNVQVLIDRLSALDGYSPSNPSISIANFTAEYAAVKLLQTAYENGYEAAKGPINSRELLFKTLRGTVTDTFNYLQSTEADEELIKDAKGLADQIRGHKINPRTLPDGSPDLDHISNSHMSFVQRAEHFEMLVMLYQGEPLYNPIEIEFMTTTLEAFAKSLKDKNEELSGILAPLIKLRLDRDHKLYDKNTGILDLVKRCKKYVRGKYKYGTPETKSITSIKFTRPPKPRKRRKKKNNNENPPPTP